MHLVTRRIDAHVAHHERPPAAGHSRGASQDRADAGDELLGVERLGHVVVHARLERLDLLQVFGARREREHRRVGLLADLAQEIEAVRVGKSEIQDDERGLLLVELHPRLRRGARVRDDELGITEIERDELGHRGIVLDHNDARGHAANATSARSSHL